MSRIIPIALLLLATWSCGNSTVQSPSSDVQDLEDTMTPECPVGARVCVDEGHWATCDDDDLPGQKEACAPDTVCLNGACRVALCAPGEVRCASWTVRRTCEAKGARWSAPSPCDVDEVCHEGQCLTCFPGEPTCATLVASAICGDDGLSFPMDDINSCTTDSSCHEPTGLCLVPECSPGETTCAGSLGRHTCLNSGTRFSPEVSPCAIGETCANATCNATGCAPHPVLFVVDRTGAIGSDWEAFRTAISTATAQHPQAHYGFMPFPMAFGCPGSGAGELPRFLTSDTSDVDEWFDTVQKSAGEAALQHTLQTVLDRAHEIFAGNAGRIILISSGANDCEGDTTHVGAIVEALRLDHGIQTYVIGHRASGAFYPALDAAHARGGSEWDDWKATSYEGDLTQAVVAAMDTVPACN